MAAGTKVNENAKPLTAAETAAEGRVYLHDTCGQRTRVRGKEMVALCDPFQYVSRTMCSACEQRDLVNRFRWSDTGESIGDFRRRMRDECPMFCRVWVFLIAPLSASIIGIDMVRQFRILTELPSNYWIEIPLGIMLVMPFFCRFIAPRVLQAMLRPSFHQQR